MNPLSRFLQAHNISIPGLLVKGGITGAAAIPAGYAIKSLIGDPEMDELNDELKGMMREIKSVKRKQIEAMKK